MQYLLKIVDAIEKEKNWEETLNHFKSLRSDIEKEILSLTQDDYNTLVSKLFPVSIPLNEDFYETISKLRLLVGYNAVTKTFLFQIWNSCIFKITIPEKHQLLELLTKNEHMDFWSFIQIFPDFCKEIKLESDFAIKWFYTLAIRINNDLGGDPFYEGLKNYVLNENNDPIQVLNQYLKDILFENEIIKQRLASILLGILRSIKESKAEITKYIEQQDKYLKSSDKLQLRISYYKSLVNTFTCGALSIESLEAELNDMLAATIQEKEEAFITVYRCYLLNQSNVVLLKFIRSWYNKAIPAYITDNIKYYIIDLLWRLLSNDNREGLSVSVLEANNIIAKILPLPMEQNGTWMQLEFYLVDRLKSDINSFRDILDKLLESDGDKFCEKLSHQFGYLKSEMINSTIIHSLAEYIFSEQSEKRKFGFIIYNTLPEQKQQIINRIEVSESILELIIYEFINYPTLSKQVADYLVMLEPYYRDVNGELQDIFKNEMALQALNYPGECLERWKKIDSPSSLLKDVIEISDNYFNNLNSNSELTISTFSFPGYEKALKRKMQLFSGQVSKDSKSKSIFYNLARSTEVIYGKSWSIFNGNTLGEKSDFKEFRTSFEFPRLEIIDPEGMALRRLQIKSLLKTL